MVVVCLVLHALAVTLTGAQLQLFVLPLVNLQSNQRQPPRLSAAHLAAPLDRRFTRLKRAPHRPPRAPWWCPAPMRCAPSRRPSRRARAARAGSTRRQRRAGRRRRTCSRSDPSDQRHSQAISSSTNLNQSRSISIDLKQSRRTCRARWSSGCDGCGRAGRAASRRT